MSQATFHPDEVLNFWFPDSGHQNALESHGAFWTERMQGGMDDAIIANFAELTMAAAIGELDHWAESPRGRLALLVALDQFPRSLWRGTPGAYGQDIKAARLAIEGIHNGDFNELLPWEQAFFVISITHCEGPEHLERMIWVKQVSDGIANRLEGPLELMREGFRNQNKIITDVIETFGRHPHRNAVLGRVSTPDELIYIAKGEFPHLNKPHEV